MAKDLGGRVQPASGATLYAKGDVRSPGLHSEAKTTSKKSYSLTLAEIEKIRTEGMLAGADGWAMQIEFQRLLVGGTKVAVIDWEIFLELWELRGKK